MPLQHHHMPPHGKKRSLWCVHNDPCGICCACVTYFLVRDGSARTRVRAPALASSVSLHPLILFFFLMTAALLCRLRRLQRAALPMARRHGQLPPRQMLLSAHLLPGHGITLPHDDHRPGRRAARVPAELAALERRAGEQACDVLTLQRLETPARPPLLCVRPVHHEDGPPLVRASAPPGHPSPPLATPRNPSPPLATPRNPSPPLAIPRHF